MSTTTPIVSAVERLVAGVTLSAPETRAAVAAMLDGEVSEAATAAFLTALRIKGETGEELLGAVAAIRDRMTTFESGRADCLDTCGTGGTARGRSTSRPGRPSSSRPAASRW